MKKKKPTDVKDLKRTVSVSDLMSSFKCNNTYALNIASLKLKVKYKKTSVYINSKIYLCLPLSPSKSKFTTISLTDKRISEFKFHAKNPLKYGGFKNKIGDSTANVNWLCMNEVSGMKCNLQNHCSSRDHTGSVSNAISDFPDVPFSSGGSKAHFLGFTLYISCLICASL